MRLSRTGSWLAPAHVLLLSLATGLSCDALTTESPLPLEPMAANAEPAPEGEGQPTDTIGGEIDRNAVRLMATTAAHSATSPHWGHMRTSTIDYRIHYQGSKAPGEWNWAASKYDVVVGGRLNEYKSRNPSIKMYVYDLLYGDEITDVQPFESWLSGKGYQVEKAYLHRSGGAKTKSNRVIYRQWGKDYYAFNLADPGFRAWRAQRTKSLVATNGAGYRFDGIFFDVFSSGGIDKAIPSVTLEYSSRTYYYNDLRQVLNEHRQYTPGNFLDLNVGNYFNKAPDKANGSSAGGVMTEYANSPYNEQRWAHVDNLVANGVRVQLSTGVSSSQKNTKRYDMNAGNYASIAQRILMWEYASYLMVVDPGHMDSVLFETYGLSWSVPMNVTWLPAFEYNLGLATQKRRVLMSGKDGAGQYYEVFAREFANGLALIRPRKGSNSKRYGDVSAVTVTLPSGTWKQMWPDGRISSAVTKVRLRNGESAIFVK